MGAVGQKEQTTQERVIKLFQEQLQYEYLGNWKTRPANSNIEHDYLKAFLKKQGYDDALIAKALFELEKVAKDQTKSLYDLNKETYKLLRYGVKVKPEAGETTVTVKLIDWKNPGNNHFAIAEEVTVEGENTKRPDIVLYINGIALGVLELKRSTVSLSEGIRQNLDNQKAMFIRSFFATAQYVMAGNDTGGLKYGTIETREKHYLSWKEDSDVANPLDRGLLQICEKARFLELIHDFVVFDAGIKKLCRPNQYFGVKAAQKRILAREGGIIWHTQGSGKSLTMVWLTKWIRENIPHARVLIITDRTELDDQIHGTFLGVDEQIHRTKSGKDLIEKLNATSPWLVCSLIHKFAGKEEGEVDEFLDEINKALPADFSAKGDIYVFVDECHRTQSGNLNSAMKSLLPNSTIVGFTGTPLMKADKRKSIEVFGSYIHTYKFDEAVADGVVLDLRYEARDVNQYISAPAKIDQWFKVKTKGLNDVALAQLKARWGTMQKVLSSKSRLETIVSDILMDFETRDRLQNGRGNALLVAGSIYEACKYYELFQDAGFAKCAIVTSYVPSTASIKGEETGEGQTEKLEQYEIYNEMLNGKTVEAFEQEVKRKFIDEPGQMRLLIVVDKLLTGFDAPSATYLYIDKQMRDHGLFQAICRVNRLDGDDKEYGYIIDYKDLFKCLESSIQDYTSGPLDGYDKDDVAGLLADRLEKAAEHLDEAREAIKALCEDVEPPKGTEQYLKYFCATDTSNKAQLKANEPKRLSLYKLTGALLRAYAAIANELEEAGYSEAEIKAIKEEVEYYETVRTEVKFASGDYIDLKMYEPAMRHLIDTYIKADESEKLSAFDDLSLIQLIVERGADAIKDLPAGLKKSKNATAEAIENNLRKVIIDAQPVNPKYYEEMSQLLDALIQQRQKAALEYEEYLKKIVELTKKVVKPEESDAYPASLSSPALRALYDNLDKNEALALQINETVRTAKEDDWRGSKKKEKAIFIAILAVIDDEEQADKILELVKAQAEY